MAFACTAGGSHPPHSHIFCKSVVRVMGNVCFGTTTLSSIWLVGYANWLEALLEPHIQSFRKPDIVAWGTDQSYIIDVAVARDDEHPDSAYAAKVAWYNHGQTTEWIKEVSGRNTYKVSEAVLNWKGAFSPAPAALLKELGLTKRDLRVVSMRTLAGGWAIWRAWRNTTWL